AARDGVPCGAHPRRAPDRAPADRPVPRGSDPDQVRAAARARIRRIHAAAALRVTRRLPFYYGWVVVAVAFVTMAIGINARTAFSLFFPPILDEFGWERGVTAAAFSLGFVVSMAFGPWLGRAMDRWGPQRAIPVGVLLLSAGLALGPFTRQPWHLSA